MKFGVLRKPKSWTWRQRARSAFFNWCAERGRVSACIKRRHPRRWAQYYQHQVKDFLERRGR